MITPNKTMLFLGFQMNSKPNIANLMQQLRDMTIFLVRQRKFILTGNLGHDLQPRHPIKHTK